MLFKVFNTGLSFCFLLFILGFYLLKLFRLSLCNYSYFAILNYLIKIYLKAWICSFFSRKIEDLMKLFVHVKGTEAPDEIGLKFIWVSMTWWVSRPQIVRKTSWKPRLHFLILMKNNNLAKLLKRTKVKIKKRQNIKIPHTHLSLSFHCYVPTNFMLQWSLYYSCWFKNRFVWW